MLHRNVMLPSPVGGAVAGAKIDSMPHDRVVAFARHKFLEQANSGTAQFVTRSPRTEMVHQDRIGRIGFNPSVATGRSVRRGNFNQRGFERNTGTPDGLHRNRQPTSIARLEEGIPHVNRTGGGTTRTLADAHLASPLTPRRAAFRCIPPTPSLGSEKVAQHARHLFGSQVAVGHRVDLHGRGQHTAPEAGDGLYREKLVSVSILVVGNPEVVPERPHNRIRPLHVAGRADADLNAVDSGGREAEL